MTRILAALDFDFATDNVLAFAGQIARTTGAELEVLNVRPVEDQPAPTGLPREELDALEDHLRRRAADALPDVEWSVTVAPAPPDTTIADAILDHSDACDLLVLGQTESRGLLGWLLGDTTGEAIDGARCPVLVVPARVDFAAPQSFTFAVDARAVDPTALAVLAEIARGFRASVDVFVDATPRWVQTQREELNLELADVPHSYTAASAMGHERTADYLLARARAVEGTWLCLRHGSKPSWRRRAKQDLGGELAKIATVPALILPDQPPSEGPRAVGLVAERTGDFRHRLRRDFAEEPRIRGV